MSEETTSPIVVRTCKCQNDHIWNQPVVYTNRTLKLSGERKYLCPKCSKEAYVCSLWKILLPGGTLIIPRVTDTEPAANPSLY